MIERIQLENFQAHEHLEFTFGKGVTTILGRTDAGKSAIFRALKWVAFNRPSGLSFLRSGADFVRVTVEVDGHVIVREKSETSNYYMLDGRKFESFGTGVPEEVTKILRLDELSFQGQFDPPFWFTETPGQVSRNLNALVNLDIIDTVQANLGSMLRKKRAEEKVVKERLEEARETRKALKVFRDMDSHLKHVEGLEEDAQKKAQNELMLAGLVEEVQLHEERILRLTGPISEGRKLVQLGERWEGLERTERGLEALVEDLQRNSHILRGSLPSLEGLEVKAAQLEELETRCNALQRLLDDVVPLERKVQVLDEQIVEEEKNFIQSIGDICPLCGAKIPQPSRLFCGPTSTSH